MVLSVLPVSELLLWSQSHGLTDRLPWLYTNWSHRRFNVSCFCQSGEVFSVSQRGRTQAARHWNLITTPLVVWKHTYKPSLINSLIHSQAEKYAVMLLHVIKNRLTCPCAHTKTHTQRPLCLREPWRRPTLPPRLATDTHTSDRQTDQWAVLTEKPPHRYQCASSWHEAVPESDRTHTDVISNTHHTPSQTGCPQSTAPR